jgi:large subunit ribosomal protein L24
MKVKKGDQVKILSGKERGKKGKILHVLPEENRVVVERINLVKKHRRSQKKNEKGERIVLPAPLNISNVQLICPKCNKATRVGFKVEGKEKFRICKKCEAQI